MCITTLLTVGVGLDSLPKEKINQIEVFAGDIRDPNGVRTAMKDIDSVIHSDGWRGYNGLVDFGYKKHFRVHHSENEFTRGNAHINGIESFWGYAKIRLIKFKGMNKNMFNLHLKECEFRF